jgi:VanZ family protein
MVTVIAAALYGASDEFHQYFVPHRSCDAADWAADLLGGSAAAVLYYIYESRRS